MFIFYFFIVTFCFLLVFAIAGFSLEFIKLINEYEQGVVFRLGRYSSMKSAGLRFIIPFMDKMFIVDLRINTLDVPTQEVITKDNIPVKVNAICYFYVSDPSKALIKVQNYLYAVAQISQTSLRSVCGELELDSMLAEREQVNKKLQETIFETTEQWGISILRVELKDIQIPESMQRAFASQAEAERERRAKVIAAEGEFQASQKLAEAAQIMQENHMSLQLRYLQTLKETSQQSNASIIAPLPLDIFSSEDS